MVFLQFKLFHPSLKKNELKNIISKIIKITFSILKNKYSGEMIINPGYRI